MPDISTVLLCNVIFITFIALVLLFYKKTQKTYPGFHQWTISTFVIALGYSTFFFRNTLLPIWLSVLFVNGSFALAGVLRLDGTNRFLNNKPITRLHYMGPAILLIFSSYFYFINDNMSYRNLFFSFYAAFLALTIAFQFFKNKSNKKNTLYRVSAFFFLLFGSELILRSLLWIFFSSHQWIAASIHVYHYLFMSAFEIVWIVTFLMMNSHRLEQSLEKTQKELVHTIENLEKALSEIKTLSGLLPICASCKSIRDDTGYWNQLEGYITKHSSAQFSHSICPDCARKLYPELYTKE